MPKGGVVFNEKNEEKYCSNNHYPIYCYYSCSLFYKMA